ncbi:MAG: hypothetical protein HFG80_01470 [Eubacterium sp.]|nr:hypothetical protein [Eubacterium sp.]
MSEKNKIIRFHKPVKLNIGIIVFIFILCYLVVQVVSYVTARHVSVYEVQQGALAANTTYTGLALYEEKVVLSEENGYVNYYQKDGAKVSFGDQIYSVDENGEYYKQIVEAAQNGSSLTQETLDFMADSIKKFLTVYEDEDFSSVYRYKEEIDAELNEALSREALEELNQETGGSFSVHTAAEPGIVAYYTDGYEGITADTFTGDMFSSPDYQKNNLRVQESTTIGTPVYKLITSEYWNIVVPIDDTLISLLAEESNVKIRFLKDDTSAWAESKIVTKDNIPYLILTLRNSLVRFLSDRFLSIELMLDKNEGLKIPKSAIIEKDFFLVPEEYFLSGDDTGSLGLLVKNEDNTDASFVNTTIYNKKDHFYYIDAREIPAGSVILKPDSSETYTVKEKDSLQGVYNINKGYAVFKKIEVTAENEEYSIVKLQTDYGLSLYDHIALDGTSMKEGELVN